jgi:hypothetical protein
LAVTAVLDERIEYVPTGRSLTSRLRMGVSLATVGLALVATTSLAMASASPTRTSWGSTQEIPGIASLNKGVVDPTAISCPSPGNCAAAGSYWTYDDPSAAPTEGFVVDEANGVWGRAQEVPGLASQSQVVSISCASQGNCAAGGNYWNAMYGPEGFVVDESDGTWGSAHDVPGIDYEGNSDVYSVTCPAPGDCVAVGRAASAAGVHGFVVDESNGTWGSAQVIPGIQDLSTVSCAAVGDCAAGGGTDPAGQGSLVEEANGVWGASIAVPVPAGLTATYVESVSCPAPGSCAATGNASQGGFVVDQTNGTWGTAQAVRGLVGLDVGGATYGFSISCAAPQECAAGGTYTGTGGRGHEQAFVVDEKSGTWGMAQEVAGLARVDQFAYLLTLSCGAAGDCAAGGYYAGAVGDDHGWVVNESGGTWGTGHVVPGLSALNVKGFASVSAVSCGPAGHCAATGSYSGADLVSGFVSSLPGTGYCSPAARLTAVVVSHQRRAGSVYYRVVFTNHGDSPCQLYGIPGALAFDSRAQVPVGPPATRTTAPGRGDVIFLNADGGQAEATYAINIARIGSKGCRPKAVDEVTLRPTGVPQMRVSLSNPYRSERLVCQGVRNEAIYGFGPVGQTLT